MSDDFSADEPQLGDNVEGQILVAVGLEFTFTDILATHQITFKLLDEWLTGIRTFCLEDTFDIDAILWDELEDCGYEIGEGNGEEDEKGLRPRLYDVWVDLDSIEPNLKLVQERVDSLERRTFSLLPVGLHAAAQSNREPAALLKLLAQTSEPE